MGIKISSLVGFMSIWRPLAIAVLAFILLSSTISSLAEDIYVVEKAILSVYRDGVVHVALDVSVNETEPLISLPLLSPQETVGNILVLDENGDPLDYELVEKNITVYCLGAAKVTLEYDTTGLTSKVLNLWTLKLTAPFDLTVLFPENTTIIYFSNIPSAIRTRDNIIEIDLYPGEWEIDYEIPIQPPSPPAPPTPDQNQQYRQLIPIEYVFAGIAAACLAAIMFLYIRGRRAVRLLRDEEAEVIRFIKERGGRALEAELRERFPHIPRTSMWRLIKRLEKQGVVRVRKVGLQNVVELK